MIERRPNEPAETESRTQQEEADRNRVHQLAPHPCARRSALVAVGLTEEVRGRTANLRMGGDKGREPGVGSEVVAVAEQGRLPL